MSTTAATFVCRRLVRPGVVHQEAAGRFTGQHDLRGIHLVCRRVRLHPPDRGVDIFLAPRESELGRHAVVDAEPGEPGVRERLKRRRHVRRAAAAVESAAVYEDGRGKRPRTVRHMEIEQERVAGGPSVFDAFLIGRRDGQARGAHEGDNDRVHEADCFGPSRPGLGLRDWIGSGIAIPDERHVLLRRSMAPVAQLSAGGSNIKRR